MLQDYLKHNLKELQKKVLLRQLMTTNQDKIKTSNSRHRYATYDTETKTSPVRKFDDKPKNILINEDERNNEELNMKKQKIQKKINYLDSLLKRLQEKRSSQLLDTPEPSKIDDQYIQNLLKLGHMSPSLLSRSKHDPRDKKQRQVYEYWVRNKKALQRKLQNNIFKNIEKQDRQERLKQMAITHRDARNKALNKMDEREKKIWNERKLQMEAEFGKNALKNIDNQKVIKTIKKHLYN